jgi:hypothetical protein
MRLRSFRCLFCWFCLLGPLAGAGQSGPAPTYAPVGKFLADTVLVGQAVGYTLVLRHPAWLEVRFPDSLTSYAPFELKAKKYFPTTTTLDGSSIDSAVYTLTTFSTDSIQRLALPVYVLSGGDTTLVTGNLDSVLLQPTVLSLPDTVKLVDHARYREVSKGINFPLIGLGLGVLLVLLLGVYLVFGERIRRSYRLRRMKRRHERFLAEFDRQKVATGNIAAMEHAVAIWKAYLQGLHRKPYTSYTSKEMAEAIPDEVLIGSLRAIDRAVYGHGDETAPQEAVKVLRNFAKDAYRKQVEEVRNA